MPSAPTTCMARAANGASRGSACIGRSSTPSSRACEEIGIPRVEDFNRGDNFGVSYFKVNQKRGIRWNASKAFLRPAAKRPNLTVDVGRAGEGTAHRGWRGQRRGLLAGGELATARADGEVILAAGAIGSPTLLEASGIGSGDVLRRLGIAVKHELSGVGENLQDHLQIRTIFKVTGARTLNERVARLHGKALIALEYALRRTGPMSMAPSQLGMFTRSDPSFDTPNIQYHIQPLSLDRFGEPLHSFPARHGERGQSSARKPRQRAHDQPRSARARPASSRTTWQARATGGWPPNPSG